MEAIKVLSWRCMLSRLNVPASLFTNGVCVLESVLGVNGTVSVQRRLRLGYAVLLFCCIAVRYMLASCFSVLLLAGSCFVMTADFISVLLDSFVSAVVFLGVSGLSVPLVFAIADREF